MKFAKNNNLFYYSGHDSWWRSQSHGGGSGDNYYQFLVDITSKKYNKLKNINTNLADFSYDDKYFAYYIDSIKKVIIYNLSNSKIESYLNYNNNNPENKLNDIAFGYTNYDLYFSTTNKLYHWSHWKGTIVDSFNLSGANGEVWQLLCSKDGKYLLAASNQGHIRIFDMEKVMSVDDIDKASQPEDLIVSPIPANQLLITNYKLRDDCFVRLSLFNQLGIEAAVLVNEFQPSGPHNSQLSILNSQLSAGVYFLKLKACGINRMKKVVIMR